MSRNAAIQEGQFVVLFHLERPFHLTRGIRCVTASRNEARHPPGLWKKSHPRIAARSRV